jgi:hypothetical protein
VYLFDVFGISFCTIDIRSFDILEYLQPFLDIILSEETSGPITGVALSAVNKFIKYGFIRMHIFVLFFLLYLFFS